MSEEYMDAHRSDDEGGPEEDLVRDALRRVEGEARPRGDFRSSLRRRFVAGELDPSVPSVEPVPLDDGPSPRARRPFGLPVPVLAAAAALLVTGAFLYGRHSADTTSPAGPPDASSVSSVANHRGPGAEPAHDPTEVTPASPVLSPLEASYRHAESVVAALPGWENLTLRRAESAGRAFLLAGADGAGEDEENALESLALSMNEAEALLSSEFAMLQRATGPRVSVVAPTRSLFTDAVLRHVAPAPLGDSTVAYDLADEGILLLSPEVLDEGGPPCEEMDIVHEAVHGWIHARLAPGAILPLWMEEGIADVVSQSFADMDTRRWSHSMLDAMEPWAQVDPFSADNVLGFTTYSEMAEHVRQRAFCDERPFTFLPAFHAQADSLVLFLTESEPKARVAFLSVAARLMDGETLSPADIAEALGFVDEDSLFAARDAWIHSDHGVVEDQVDGD